MNNWCWPLYGAGLDNLGISGKPVVQELPEPTDDEILVRHDAVGLCYTDVKEITFGNTHPRLIGRDLKDNPIVPGHEASMTVLAVGRNLRDTYAPGQRYVIQPDVWYKGKSIPYSFGMDGAYRQYGVLGKEILDGDEGCYLIPVPESMCYAGAALTEPWACVEASYLSSYRKGLKSGGVLWLVADKTGHRQGYEWQSLIDSDSLPAGIVVSGISVTLSEDLKAFSQKHHITYKQLEYTEVLGSGQSFEDIIMLDVCALSVGTALQRLANGGILAYFGPRIHDEVPMDLGRIHYDHVLLVGSEGLDLSQAYTHETRAELKPGGITLMQGAGGPMGLMHVQRAMESAHGPRMLVATDTDDFRLSNLQESLTSLAKKKGIQLVCLNPITRPLEYQQKMKTISLSGGFDDIQVMITHLPSIKEAYQMLAASGTMSVFAGLKRGTSVSLDISRMCDSSPIRLIGHSGSGLKDQIAIIDRYEAGQLETRRSVAAIGGFAQVPEGIVAMEQSTYAGKIVIYPGVKDFPLCSLKELKKKLPEVFVLLENGSIWTKVAEREFLKLMHALPVEETQL